MGRHSVPDDDTVDGAPSTPVRVDELLAAAGSRPRPARHSGPATEALTDPEGVPPVEPPRAEPIARSAPHVRGGTPAKPRPGGPLRPAAARTGPPPRAEDDTSPGLALIERAMTGPRTDPVETTPEPAIAADETVQIEAIADPVLDEAVPEAVTEKLRPVPARPTEVSVAPTEGTAVPDEDTAPAADPAPPKKGDGRTSDLALLRADSAVRARVVAAVVVPFLLYVSVLLITDSLDVRTALIWIWIPLITAGVIGGLLLDIAHRERAAKDTTEQS